MPHNLKLPEDVKANTKKLLQMKVNKLMLRADLENKLNKNISLKDLRNLQQKGVKNSNNMEIVCEKIQQKFGKLKFGIIYLLLPFIS